ncbi:MAG TPA: hypothetical protein PLZ42_05290 [Methanothrix sp.]|nr:hypothetical protein [Methanothrix sp.]
MKGTDLKIRCKTLGGFAIFEASEMASERAQVEQPLFCLLKSITDDQTGRKAGSGSIINSEIRI